jgi:hypothetical protein
MLLRVPQRLRRARLIEESADSFKPIGASTSIAPTLERPEMEDDLQV